MLVNLFNPFSVKRGCNALEKRVLTQVSLPCPHKLPRVKTFLVMVNLLYLQGPGPHTNHFQEHSLSFSLRFVNLNATQLLIG